VVNEESQSATASSQRIFDHLHVTVRVSEGQDRAATDVQVYFCDPRSPWQRGTNENTNRLLRQYFPKRTDLSAFTQADLNRVALRLNQRPRKTPDFRCPADVFDEFVALTG
jgi:IS30 family transposase